MLEFLIVLVLIVVCMALIDCDPDHESCQPEIKQDHQTYFDWEDSK